MTQAERMTKLGQTAVGYRRIGEVLNPGNGFLRDYDHSLNPYGGCSFGCTYCYAAFFQRTKAQQDTWGEWVTVKENAPDLIAGLPAGKLDGKRIYMSSVTDPYQPVERKSLITRRILELMAQRHAPRLVVQTRSPLVTRDIDLFGKIEERGGRVQVNMTVTTDDEDVRKTFEPGCPSNPARLKAIGKVQKAGIQSCITMTPLLMVRDLDGFADSLLATGVERFILQGFHFEKGDFIRQTREEAFRIMAEKLGCTARDFRPAYERHCREARRVLAERLPQMGEGQRGFAPPF